MATKAGSKKGSSKKSSQKSSKKSSQKTRQQLGSKGPQRPLSPCALRYCYCKPPTDPDDYCPACCELGPLGLEKRATCAEDIRVRAAAEARNPQEHPCNGDEACYQGVSINCISGDDRRCDDTFKGKFIASFTKGLPHDELGEVDGDVYCKLLHAMGSGNPDEFEKVMLGCGAHCARHCPPECRPMSRKLENPQAAFAFDLEGADSHALMLPPAPSFDSAQEIAEIAENYWMALARDVPFTEYISDPLIADAANDLSQYNCFFGPTTPEDLFRGTAYGEQFGPYISQFLYMDTPYGSQFIPAMIQTVLPGIDYVTAYPEWLQVQNGCDRNQTACDRVPRFIRSGRDLGQYVHVDLTFNAFLNAALILLAGRDPLRRCEARPGLGVPFAQCLPYINPTAPGEEEFPDKSENQIGFATFGPPHVTALLLEAMERALKVVWFQKWAVHRRLRPEEFAGRIHVGINTGRPYPFDPVNFAQLNVTLLPRIVDHNERQNSNRRMPPPPPPLPPELTDGKSFLLPLAFAEGSPIHPAYGAGHATVAGALGTIIKAFFPGDQLILNPVVSTPDGLSIVPYEPVRAEDERLTVEIEINKLVSNIALGRNFAGVHWRTDYSESMRLGEDLAISILCDQRNTYNEAYQFRFRRYDGTWVSIQPGYASDGSKCPTEESEHGSKCERTRRPDAPSC